MFFFFLAENLQNLIFTHLGNGYCQPEDSCAPGLPRRAETFGGYDSTPSISNNSKKEGLWGYCAMFVDALLKSSIHLSSLALYYASLY